MRPHFMSFLWKKITIVLSLSVLGLGLPLQASQPRLAESDSRAKVVREMLTDAQSLGSVNLDKAGIEVFDSRGFQLMPFESQVFPVSEDPFAVQQEVIQSLSEITPIRSSNRTRDLENISHDAELKKGALPAETLKGSRRLTKNPFDILSYPRPVVRVHFINITPTASPLSVQPLFVAPNDEFYGEQWGLDVLGIENAWLFNQGEGIVVAIIDSGLDMTHPDIAANIFSHAGEIPGNGIDDDLNGYIDDVNGYNFRFGNNNPEDLLGHGSHVAGIVGAISDNDIGIAGVAPNSMIMPLKSISAFETSLSIAAAIDATIEAIYYATDNGAHVINMSLGFLPSWFRNAAHITEFLDAIDYAQSQGVVVVTAAGNTFGAMTSYPEMIDEIIAVGAVYQSILGGVFRAGFSSTGPTLDLMAPGVDILSLCALFGTTSCWPTSTSDYAFLDGTSMASPMVAGVVALLLAQDPTQSVEDIQRRLMFSADDMGAAGFDTSHGYGLVNPFAALSYDYYDDGTMKTNFLHTPDGSNSIRYDFDLMGRTIRQEYADGSFTTFEDFYPGTDQERFQKDYDADGNLVETREYDINGDLIVDPPTECNADACTYYASGRIHTENFGGTIFEYFDEDFENNRGRISRITLTNGNEYLFTAYWDAPGVQTVPTDAVKTLEHYFEGDLIKTYSFHEGTTFIPGGPIKLSEIVDHVTGNQFEYYLSGRVKAERYADGSANEYLDEDFGGSGKGRLSSITLEGGVTEVRITEYWGDTDYLKTLDLYVSSILTTTYTFFENTSKLGGPYVVDEIIDHTSSAQGAEPGQEISSVQIFGASGYFEMLEEKSLALEELEPQGPHQSSSHRIFDSN